MNLVHIIHLEVSPMECLFHRMHYACTSEHLHSSSWSLSCFPRSLLGTTVPPQSNIITTTGIHLAPILLTTQSALMPRQQCSTQHAPPRCVWRQQHPFSIVCLLHSAHERSASRRTQSGRRVCLSSAWHSRSGASPVCQTIPSGKAMQRQLLPLNCADP